MYKNFKIELEFSFNIIINDRIILRLKQWTFLHWTSDTDLFEYFFSEQIWNIMKVEKNDPLNDTWYYDCKLLNNVWMSILLYMNVMFSWYIN